MGFPIPPHASTHDSYHGHFKISFFISDDVAFEGRVKTSYYGERIFLGREISINSMRELEVGNEQSSPSPFPICSL